MESFFKILSICETELLISKSEKNKSSVQLYSFGTLESKILIKLILLLFNTNSGYIFLFSSK